MRTGILIVVLLLPAAARAQKQYVPYLQKALLTEVAACGTVKCVDGVLAKAPYIDPPLRLIAASKVHALKGPGAQARLLKAIPKDPVAFWFCYSVTVPNLGKGFETVVPLYDTFFPAAAAAAAATGEVADFLLLTAFADGEMATAIDEAVATIRKRNQPAYCKALHKLHPDVRRGLPACNHSSR